MTFLFKTKKVTEGAIRWTIGAMEECTICLETLVAEHTQLTRLQPCAHRYHAHCLALWRNHSNQCPTCRADYAVLETVTHRGELVMSEAAVSVAVPPVVEFFEENVAMQGDDDEAQRDRVQRRIEQLVGRYNVCVLCDRASGHVLSCRDCSSTFHGQCLGLMDATRLICPMCSCEQSQERERTSRFRRNRLSERTNRVYNILTDNGRDANIPAMEEHVVERCEGSVDEQNAWAQFERARREDNEVLLVAQGTSGEGVRKQKLPSRRRRPLQVPVAQETAMPRQREHSLVGKLVNEMKSNYKHELLLPMEQPTPRQPTSPQSCASSSSG